MLLRGRCLDTEAATLVDDDDPSQAVPLAVEAAEIGVVTRSPQLTRLAYLNLALAYLRLNREQDAESAADAAARLCTGMRAVGALGLQGIIAFRRGRTDSAYLAFLRACHIADRRLEREDGNYQVHEDRAVALCGLALCNELEHTRESIASFRRARAITKGSALGAIRRCRILLAQFGDAADPSILMRVRRANDGLPELPVDPDQFVQG